jgi:hypothetical protein
MSAGVGRPWTNCAPAKSGRKFASLRSFLSSARTPISEPRNRANSRRLHQNYDTGGHCPNVINSNSQPPPERWPSGLRRTLGKRVYFNEYRGFESHSLRQYPAQVAESASYQIRNSDFSAPFLSIMDIFVRCKCFLKVRPLRQALAAGSLPLPMTTHQWAFFHSN